MFEFILGVSCLTIIVQIVVVLILFWLVIQIAEFVWQILESILEGCLPVIGWIILAVVILHIIF